jgi:pyruvate formate lyase activating enzyme
VTVPPRTRLPAVSALRGAGARADDLTIAGLVPLSSVDWPGKLVATVFCQGCPWNCAYCHNASLIDCALPGLLRWDDDVESLLSRRRGLLDGVVFTGGEATRQAALAPAMARVRELGFEVGLHTGGAYLHRLTEVLPLVDWVGLDIKALPEDYGTVTGVAAAGARAWEALGLMLDAGVGHEVRLTLHPDSPQADTAIEIARRLRDAGVRVLVIQEARAEGTREAFQQRAQGWDLAAWNAQLDAIRREVADLGFEHFSVR